MGLISRGIHFLLIPIPLRTLCLDLWRCSFSLHPWLISSMWYRKMRTIFYKSFSIGRNYVSRRLGQPQLREAHDLAQGHSSLYYNMDRYWRPCILGAFHGVWMYIMGCITQHFQFLQEGLVLLSTYQSVIRNRMANNLCSSTPSWDYQYQISIACFEPYTWKYTGIKCLKDRPDCLVACIDLTKLSNFYIIKH